MPMYRGTDKIARVDKMGRLAAGQPGDYYRVEHGTDGRITLTPVTWVEQSAAATPAPKAAAKPRVSRKVATKVSATPKVEA